MSDQRRTTNLDRAASSASVIDVLDHVLDKGIVIDAWVRVSLAGIDLLTVEARVVVASIGTYLNYAGVISELGPVSRPVGERHPATLEQQLQQMANRTQGRQPGTQLRRRAEDRWRDERRDAHARTILKKH